MHYIEMAVDKNVDLVMINKFGKFHEKKLEWYRSYDTDLLQIHAILLNKSVNPFSTETVLLVDYWSPITYTLLYT